jgi:hypothetical protein
MKQYTSNQLAWLRKCASGKYNCYAEMCRGCPVRSCIPAGECLEGRAIREAKRILAGLAKKRAGKKETLWQRADRYESNHPTVPPCEAWRDGYIAAGRSK